MGAKITSGSSKGHPVLRTVWQVYLGMGVGLTVLGLIFASAFEGGNLRFGNLILDLEWIFRVGGFILAGYCLINAAAYNSQVSKTEITVYEEGISGTGINPKSASERFTFPIFTTPSYASSTFSFTYDQISTVTVAEQKGININAAGVIYVVLVSNLDEIMREISSRMKK